MKKLLLAIMALGAGGLCASAANAQFLPQTTFPTVQLNQTAVAAGLSTGFGQSDGQGFAAGFGGPGTVSGGVAGYQSIGQGGGTTAQNAILQGGPENTLKIDSSNGTGGAFHLESNTLPGNNINNHTYAGGTSAAIGGGATSGYAFANTNGGDPHAVGIAASSADGFGVGFSISAATSIAPLCIGPGCPLNNNPPPVTPGT